MTILLIGADSLGNICEKFQSQGVDRIIHWDGRYTYHKSRSLPKNIEKVFIFYDFISHPTMKSVRKQAKKNKIPIIYCKRSLSDLSALTNL